MKRIYGHKFYKFLRLPDMLPLFGNEIKYLDPLVGLKDFNRLSREDAVKFFLKYNNRLEGRYKAIENLKRDKRQLDGLYQQSIRDQDALKQEIKEIKSLKETRRPLIEEFVFFMGLMALIVCLMKGIHAALS